LAGVPVLLIPQVMEQYLAGLPLEKTGAGLMLRNPSAMDQCADLIGELTTNTHYALAAKAFARRHVEFAVESSCARLLASVALDTV
jgi:UDP:flavonoid glycosyltransferase YjiC (YdhE family)